MKTNKSYQAIEILKLNADLLNECYDFFKKLKDKFPEMPIENELLEALSLSSIAQKSAPLYNICPDETGCKPTIHFASTDFP